MNHVSSENKKSLDQVQQEGIQPRIRRGRRSFAGAVSLRNSRSTHDQSTSQRRCDRENRDRDSDRKEIDDHLASARERDGDEALVRATRCGLHVYIPSSACLSFTPPALFLHCSPRLQRQYGLILRVVIVLADGA